MASSYVSTIFVFFILSSPTPSVSRKGGGNPGGFTESNVRRIHQLALLKVRILNGLNLPTAPSNNKTIGKPAISQVVLNQLHYQSELVARTGPSDNMAVLLLSEPTDKDGIVQFKLTGNGNNFKKNIKSVQMFVRLRRRKKKRRPRNVDPRKRRKHFKPRKMKILIHGFHPKKKRMKRLVVKELKMRRKKWLNLKLPTKFIRKVARSNSTLVLQITCKRCSKWAEIDLAYKSRTKSKVVGGKEKTKKMLNAHRPYIIIHNKAKKRKANRKKEKQRPRRDLDETCEDLSNVTSCCTKPLYVSFAEMGWDSWILYPRGFTTGTCIGPCALHGNALPLSRDQTCRPSESMSLSVVYFKNRNVIIRRTIPNLIEAACACQRQSPFTPG